ncbi:NADPH dependent diflavin oxidoreductase-like protein 1 [Ampelomyces quisqualis]|uniref:NADPH-dependent diflavin oxidoreductase 1 n=1 Tax=Ampelomyces quisqualis TaxID=50730 RepID=A0A6A5QPH7_AMPQU|nr:NADPH dependent diflavin oxidoreductase-like protein 1 [Ampelomyces quisqualis]
MASALMQQPRRALVVYGSETGNAQDVAEEMGRLAVRLRFDTDVAELDAITLKQLLQCHVVLVAIATSGQGDLPPNSQKFWKSIRSTRLRPACLQQMRFASFGLGDSSYPKFNWAHRKLYNRLTQLGAQPICHRGESDDQQPEGIDGSFVPWSITLRQHLLERYPLPEGIDPIPDHVLLEPNWILDFVDQPDATSQNGTNTTPLTNGNTLSFPPPDLLPIPNSLTATITSNDRITPESHWQDVRHLKLSTPLGHPYIPGSTLTIYPKNFPADVNEFLSIMNWSSIADTPLHFTPTSPSTAKTTPPLPHLTSTTLRTLLTNHLDILSIPRRSFFAHLAHYTTDPFQRERLLEFTDPQYIDELYDYTTRPRRSILEVLQEFETVKIPWQRIVSLIPAIRGRQFSIASADRGTGEVELLIAIVKYKTVIKKIRQGVCTRYIESLGPGGQISVTMQKGGLGVKKEEVDRPVVMVGPGTGVAPMRSLVYQRMMWRSELGLADEDVETKDLLFFGCRNSEADYFFKDEWTDLQQKGVPLDVLTAFSRDQRQKVYVQDLVRQQSRRVYDALASKSGVVYICGSSGKMPQAIREALLETFEKHGEMDRDTAEKYLAGMEKAGRYRQETW